MKEEHSAEDVRLLRLLQRDHKCWNHNGPGSGACKTCRRRAGLIEEYIAARAAEAQAEAVREAANDIETALLDEMVPETVKQADVVWYLRRRAERIERNKRDGGESQ